MAHLERLRTVGDATGLSVYATNEILARTSATLTGVGADAHGLTGRISVAGTVLRTFSAFEVACLDIQGRLANRPVVDLLGGLDRSSVPFSGYLFYKWPGHPGEEPDTFGSALDSAGVVAQARWILSTFGFSALKLKGGVMSPDEEIEAVSVLRDAFPDVPLRLDPNAAWTVPTAVRVGQSLEGVLEYLEDPLRGWRVWPTWRARWRCRAQLSTVTLKALGGSMI